MRYSGTIIRKTLGISKGIRLFIHKLVDEEEATKLVESISKGHRKRAKDNEARVLADTGKCIAYRLENCIYFIPAKRKELPVIITIDKASERPVQHVVYEYPCEMKVEDLTEY